MFPVPIALGTTEKYAALKTRQLPGADQTAPASGAASVEEGSAAGLGDDVSLPSATSAPRHGGMLAGRDGPGPLVPHPAPVPLPLPTQSPRAGSRPGSGKPTSASGKKSGRGKAPHTGRLDSTKSHDSLVDHSVHALHRSAKARLQRSASVVGFGAEALVLSQLDKLAKKEWTARSENLKRAMTNVEATRNKIQNALTRKVRVGAFCHAHASTLEIIHPRPSPATLACRF